MFRCQRDAVSFEHDDSQALGQNPRYCLGGSNLRSMKADWNACLLVSHTIDSVG